MPLGVRLERRLRRSLGAGPDSLHENALPADVAANTLDLIGLEADHRPRQAEVAA